MLRSIWPKKFTRFKPKLHSFLDIKMFNSIFLGNVYLFNVAEAVITVVSAYNIIFLTCGKCLKHFRHTIFLTIHKQLFLSLFFWRVNQRPFAAQNILQFPIDLFMNLSNDVMITTRFQIISLLLNFRFIASVLVDSYCSLVRITAS